MEQFIFNKKNLGTDPSGKPILSIDGEENFHLSRVLRVRAGEKILATDGAGKTLLCVVSSVGKNSSLCHVLEEYNNLNAPSRDFCIAMALLKPISKIETAIEKCTELGTHKFLLFYSERSEKAIPRLERLQAILKAAVKQSLRSRIPELVFLENLNQVVERSVGYGQKMVLHEKAETMAAERLSGMIPGTSVIALIGPEGGFSDNEIAYLIENRYASLSLGKGRLRSETAAISAATLLSSF